MSEPRPFASLTSGLLARKGAARPAMRPQLASVGFDPIRAGFAEDDLGWNDLGDESAAVPVAAPADISQPDILRRLEALAGAIIVEEPAVSEPAVEPAADEGGEQAFASLASMPMGDSAGKAIAETIAAEVAQESLASNRPVPEIPEQPARRRVSALASGRKAAFTLRLDAERHLRLRLASTIQNRSAQQVVTAALDGFLDSIAGLEDLARRARRS